MKSDRRKQALRLLKRKKGATVDQMAEKLETSERSVRNLIDNLRRAGHEIQNIGSCRFQALTE